MEQQFFKKISNMIDNAISAYEELLVFYKEKKQALLKQDTNMLALVDEKIVAQVKYITNLNKRRETFCQENELEPVRITELIELAQKECPDFEELYEQQKVKIRNIADELALVEKANVELLKHSLTMSDKLLDIIISAAGSQKDSYDQHGKNIEANKITIGSVVEEA